MSVLINEKSVLLDDPTLLYNESQAVVASVLSDLSLRTPEEIVATLEAARIEGTRDNPRHCPLAHYLLRVTGRAVSVGSDFVVVSAVPLALPGPARMVVWWFDEGRLDHLEAKMPPHFPPTACTWCAMP